MTAKPLIILVDDETDLSSALAEYLKRRGYRAETASDGSSLDLLLGRIKPDLIVLDLAMPGEGGRSILSRLKPKLSIPFIILTSTDDAVDRIVLIESGADDYAVKPISPRELAARVGRLLSRYGKHVPEVIRLEAVTAELGGGLLLYDDGTVGKLTSSEIDLLRVFASKPGRVLTREDILSNLQEEADESEVFDRSIDNRISRIRKKLKTELISTVRGAGYKFAPQE